MKKLLTATLLTLTGVWASAAIPQGYYNSLLGKKESALKEAAKALGKDHKVVSYGEETWTAFELTDVVLVGDRPAWRDMYSNELVWVETGHGSLNIEHSVPKSWWGGTVNEAYQDLFHLNPSNPSANNRKSNWPLGIVGSVSWTNGITTLGSPTGGTGGGAATVFEPADEFKGDFARAYFYVFTTYDALPWMEETDWMYDTEEWAYPTLQQWAINMLLDWAEKDPVDSYELARNEAIYGIQGNRNPFIDIPELAQYVWGDKKGTVFQADGLKDPTPVDRPEAPTFGDYEITEFNTYAGRWWTGFTLDLDVERGATAEYRLNGGNWQSYTGGISIDGAAEEGEKLIVEARCSWTASGLTLTSSVSKLTLTAKDPEKTDYKDATWRALTEEDQLSDETFYILVSTKTFNIMSAEGDASSSNKYVTTAGTVSVKDGWVTSIPENAALLAFGRADETDGDLEVEFPIYEVSEAGAPLIISVHNLSGSYIGALYTKAARQMIISTNQFSTATVTPGTEFSVIDFGANGTLQFNTSSPRFVPYTSSQEPVQLYVYDPEGPKEPDFVEEITVGFETERIFNLQGQEMTGRTLAPGLYIVVKGDRAVKIIK